MHLFLALRDYNGPLVVYSSALEEFELPENKLLEEHPCYFCGKIIKRMKDHLKNAHTNEITKRLEENKADGGVGLKCSLQQFITLLIYEARFRDQNLPALQSNRGILRPARASSKWNYPNDMTSCCACKQLVAKAYWSNHCTNCVYLMFLGIRPSVHGNNRSLYNR